MFNKKLKKLLATMALVVMAVSTVACGSSVDKNNNINNESSEEISSDEIKDNNVDETFSEEAEKIEDIENTDNTENNEELNDNSEKEINAEDQESDSEENIIPSSFKYEDLDGVLFEFSSGAGGWSTEMKVKADGSFSGSFHDSDMGDAGEDYPDGTLYLCSFSGQFGELEKVNDYTYKTVIKEINYQDEIGKEEISDDVRVIYTEVYGLENSENILFYMPGAKIEDLPEGYRSWIFWSLYDNESGEEIVKLPFYGIYNEAMEEGFSSCDEIENFKENFEFNKQYIEDLEKDLQEGHYPQQPMNVKSYVIYKAWDEQLNSLWSVLTDVLDEDEMEKLREEQRQWIKEKEASVEKAGKEFEGGSMQPLVENNEASRMTKERIFELMKYLE